MAVIASWSGTGLADGTGVTTSTAGTGDTAFTTATSGAAQVDTSGLHSPRIQVDQAAATAAELIWDSTVVGTSRTAWAARVYVELSAWPPSNGGRLLSAYTASNALMWFVDLTTAGLLRLRNAGGSAVSTSALAIPTATEMRIEAVHNNGSVTVNVYTGDGTTVFTSVSATGLGTGSGLEAVRFGMPSTSPTWPTFYLDEMAVADTAAEIGPVAPPEPPPDIPATVAPEVPVFLPGVPVGSLPEEFNAKVRDPFTGLLAPPTFRARNTAGQTIAENIVQAVTWDTIDEDPYAGWSAGSPTRYTVPDGWAGWWHATANVSLSGTGATGLALIPSIAVNSGLPNLGSVYEGQEVFVPTGVAAQVKTVNSAWWVYAKPGDVIEVTLWYSTESTITAVDTTAGLECRLELIWDGA